MKNEQFDESESSDCALIEKNEKPKLEKILIKKSPSGNYTVEKSNNDNKFSPEKLIKTSNKTTFLMVPVVKHENVSDQAIDSANSYELEHYPTTNLLENNFEEDSSSCECDSTSLDPIILPRSVSEGYFTNDDCFFGGESDSLSGLEELSRHASIEKKIKYSDMQLEEPVLEKLFTDITDSQATTNSISSQGSDLRDVNDSFVKTEMKLVDEDGSLLVINRSDSNVFVAGYD